MLDLDVQTVVVLLCLMVAAYSVRAWLYIRQTNAVLDVLREVKNTWPYHALGRGSHRGRKAVVIVGAGEDLVVQKAFLLQGITVFARPKPCEALENLGIEELARAPETPPPSGMRAAGWRAAGVAGRFILEHPRSAPEEQEETIETDSGSMDLPDPGCPSRR